MMVYHSGPQIFQKSRSHLQIISAKRVTGPGVAYWLRHCATSRTVSGSISGGVTGDFFRGYRQNHVPSGRLSL